VILALLATLLLAQAEGEVPEPAVVGSSGAFATVGSNGTATVLPSDAPRLYLDCVECDLNYIRENVGFVVYVRDRADADVHVIVTLQLASDGGYGGTLRFLGLGRFAGIEDEATVFIGADASLDDLRKELARGLRIGLARYAARTRVGRELDVAWTSAGAPPADENDPWNRWVMTLGANGSFTGESSYQENLGNGSATAARVTDLWKIQLQGYGNYSESRFDLGDGVVIESFERSSGGSFLAGRGFGDHVTLAVRPTWSTSTFSNTRSQPAATALFEWSVFPYSEATRRSLVFQVGPRVERRIYYEETIFEKRQETLFRESASIAVDTTQPWGSISGTLFGSHYFHDVSKASAYLTLQLSLRLVRGLSLTLFGSGSLIRDQLYLPKAGATDEEILLRRQQLATQYDYSSSIGLTYTFGSKFTPVVNTRLSGY